jgi:hypothetical protein
VRVVGMNNAMIDVLIGALQLLFELLVPRSLDHALREIVIALLVVGGLWLYEQLRQLGRQRFAFARA